MKTKSDFEGLGCSVVAALVAAFGFAAYRGLDSVGWVPHREDSVVTAQANWFVGESKDCMSVPMDDDTAVTTSRTNGYALARVTCDDGPEHNMRVTFYGKVNQPNYAWVSWRCVRSEDSFTCRQTGSSPEIQAGALTGAYSGRVHNKTAQMSAAFETTIREQHGNVLSGCMSVHRPLYGSGKISGDSSTSQVTFEVPSSVGVIHFAGTLEGDGFAGSYTVQRTGATEYGDFELHRHGDLPTDFDPNNCPDDSIVH